MILPERLLLEADEDERRMQIWCNEHFPGQITIDRVGLTETADMFFITGPCGEVMLNSCDIDGEEYDAGGVEVQSGTIGAYEYSEKFNRLENALRRACDAVISGKFEATP